MAIDYKAIKYSLQNGAEAIARKSQDFLEISSLKMRISSDESKIKDFYNELGEKYYKLYRHGKDENSTLKKICKKIDEMNEDINFLKKKIRTMDYIDK